MLDTGSELGENLFFGNKDSLPEKWNLSFEFPLLNFGLIFPVSK